ncbi:uncharacterized protein [Leuresthes tenuis]|uniref:uncharacterized protein n=1 Tax=Leuresthes tenuis TaxID=355514 RepID=UPI003B51405C
MSAGHLRQFVGEGQTAGTNAVFEESIVQCKEETDCQLDISWKPQINLLKSGLPQVHVCKEEVQTDEEHCNQEGNFSLDQEESELPEIKEEQEELCVGQEGELLVVVLKEEPDTLMVTPTCAESDHNVPEQKGDQVLSQNSPVTDRKDEEEKKHFRLGSVRNSDLNPSEKCLKNTSHSHIGGSFPMSESLCDSGANKDVFKCDVCGKVFNSKPRMRNHHKIHTRQKRYPCSTCGKKFKDASTLKYHVRTHTGEKPYSCENCTKCFSCYGKLLVHMRIHTGDKPYLCNTCGRGFSQSSALKRHTAIHTDEKLYSCKICGKSFAQNSDVTVHMRTHTGEKPYVCNTCGRRFSDSSAFKRHKAIHINEKTHSCKICGKSFRQSGHLLRHLTIHTGDKPFSCEKCGKRFRQSNNLMRHLKIHSEDGSYACNTCGKQFIRPSWLKRHIDSHR